MAASDTDFSALFSVWLKSVHTEIFPSQVLSVKSRSYFVKVRITWGCGWLRERAPATEASEPLSCFPAHPVRLPWEATYMWGEDHEMQGGGGGVLPLVSL